MPPRRSRGHPRGRVLPHGPATAAQRFSAFQRSAPSKSVSAPAGAPAPSGGSPRPGPLGSLPPRSRPSIQGPLTHSPLWTQPRNNEGRVGIRETGHSSRSPEPVTLLPMVEPGERGRGRAPKPLRSDRVPGSLQSLPGSVLTNHKHNSILHPHNLSVIPEFEQIRGPSGSLHTVTRSRDGQDTLWEEIFPRLWAPSGTQECKEHAVHSTEHWGKEHCTCSACPRCPTRERRR